MKDLLRFNLDKYKFLVFDTETEGLNLNNSRPWEIAWHIYHGKKLVEKHQYYIRWPNLNVSEGAARVTGFNPKIIEEKGRDPKEVIDLFDSYIYDRQYTILGANIMNYDIFIHNVARKALGYKTDYSYLSNIIDTNNISKAYKLDRKPPLEREDFIPFQYRCLNHRQKGLKTSNSFMAKEFGISVDETKLHGAEFDIELTAAVFFNLVEKVDLIHYK